MLRTLIVLFFQAICLHIVLAQEAKNTTFAFEKGLIVVRYDFLNGDPEEEYEFFLYSSHDNFAKPMQMVSGDVGQGITTGTQKTIYWDAKSEMGNFKGNVKLKVVGAVYEPLVVIDNAFTEEKIRRGRELAIRWTSSFDAEEALTLEVMRFSSSLQEFDIANEGSFTWTIPPGIKAGQGYSVRISQRNNPLKYETSASFRVRPKMPVGFKILPFAAAAGVAAVVLSLGGNDASIEGPPPLPSNP